MVGPHTTPPALAAASEGPPGSRQDGVIFTTDEGAVLPLVTVPPTPSNSMPMESSPSSFVVAPVMERDGRLPLSWIDQGRLLTEQSQPPPRN